MIANEIKYNDKKIPILVQHESVVKDREFKPKVDAKKCTKCTLCAVFCPHDCVKIKKDSLPIIDYNLCTGCLVCLRECPWMAISEVKENE
jgi:2-oxoacid:acceptor oxidoreductase delta subunit (pyruvate/2-ketoisovalerate family)